MRATDDRVEHVNAKWHFNERRPADTANDPANDAFFTADKLENLSEALVREGIQNSLDAAQRKPCGVREVRVRIGLVKGAGGAARRCSWDLFEADREHFGGGIHSGNGLGTMDCSYLTFEDFGTTGLTGDVTAWRVQDGPDNAFWSFFRAIGISGKGADSLGRWGIGKQVFPAASRMHAMFGLTVREEEPRWALMGAAVLRSRTVGNVDFDPHARFGVMPTEPRQPILPVQEKTDIDWIASAFDLKRGNDLGLSIIVPWLDDRVNSDDLRRGIVRNFFWPLLQGELIVELHTPEKTWTFDAERVVDQLDLLPAAEAAVVRFANWAAFQAEKVVKLPVEGAIRPSWATVGDALFQPSVLETIRRRLTEDQRVAVEVPVRVRLKGEAEEISNFQIFYEPCHDAGASTVFLREGIVITDVRRPPSGASRSLVVVNKGPLARLLGDSEGVNHTQWQKDSPKFHGRYTYGPETITFVSRAVGEFLKRLHPAEGETDPRLLIDLFFVPTEEKAVVERTRKPTADKGGGISGEGGGAPSRVRTFELRRIESGFLLVPGKAVPSRLPMKLRIEVGYAVRRGNAFKRWAADDFQFCRAPLRYEPKPRGAVILTEAGNSMLVEVRQADFELGVVGFDRKRDLVVRAVEVNDEKDV